MKPFINQVADFLQNKFQGNYKEVAVIFPGMRPGRRLLIELQNQSPMIQWAPSVFSLEGLMFELYGTPPSDEILLLHTLYEVFYPNPELAIESFSQFMSKGKMLLRDFDELDRYLLDADALFQIVFDEKEIEARFNLHQEPELVEALTHFMGGLNHGQSEESRDLLLFWDLLPQRYAQFKERLETRGLAYTGMIYRSLAGRLNEIEPLKQYQHIVLAGFNALSTGEEAFFDYWQKEGKAWFCWDADRYFLDDAAQESGTFLRQYVQRYPPAIPFSDQLGAYHRDRPEPEMPKLISLIGLPLHQSMARFLPTILSQIPTHEWAETAVVLPDEQLCLTVLQSLAPGSFNVTMGIPVNQSKASHFLQLLLGFWRYQLGDHGVSISEARDFLLHPFTRALAQVAELESWLSKAIQAIQVPHIEDPNHPFFLPIAPGEGKANAELGNRLTSLLALIPNACFSTLDLAFIQTLAPALTRLSSLVNQSSFRPPLVEWLKLIPAVLEDKKLSFDTDLSGIQVCGLLETRGLQFRHVIVLSMNEGIVPRGGGNPSFLPYALRKAVGLPTADERAGLSAYYLQRLIGGAHEVALLYNVITESSKAEEPSRFIAQLQEESWIKFRKFQGQLPVDMLGARRISVPRTAETKQLMADFLQGKKAFTPKHINQWLDCKLKFWWSSVLRIPEQAEQFPQADSRFLGNALHGVMEDLFKNKSTIFTEAEIEQLDLTSKIEFAFRQVYQEEVGVLPEQFQFNGEFKLLQEVCKRMILSFLKLDLSQKDVHVEAVEKAFQIKLAIPGYDDPILLGGKADRIQTQSSKTWIVDYKTGKSEKPTEEIEQLFERENVNRPHYALQTLWYAWLQLEENQAILEVGAKVYYMRESKLKSPQIIAYQGFSRLDEDKKLEAFKAFVMQVLNEIMVEDTPFTQCENKKICINCAYNTICRRS